MLLRTLALLALIVPATSLAEKPDAATLQLWTKKCANCHGDDGKAQTKLGKKYKADDFTDAGWQARHDDAKIEKAIRQGKPKSKMKAFEGKLTDAEIKALVQVVRSFDPGKQTAKP